MASLSSNETEIKERLRKMLGLEAGLDHSVLSPPVAAGSSVRRQTPVIPKLSLPPPSLSTTVARGAPPRQERSCSPAFQVGNVGPHSRDSQPMESAQRPVLSTISPQPGVELPPFCDRGDFLACLPASMELLTPRFAAWPLPDEGCGAAAGGCSTGGLRGSAVGTCAAPPMQMPRIHA